MLRPAPVASGGWIGLARHRRATCSSHIKLSIAQLFIYAYSLWYTRGSWIITGLTGLLILTYYHTYRSVRAIRVSPSRAKPIRVFWHVFG